MATRFGRWFGDALIRFGDAWIRLGRRIAGRTSEKTSPSNAESSAQVPSAPPPSYLQALVQQTQGGSVEERIQDAFRILHERGGEIAFSADEIEQAVHAHFGEELPAGEESNTASSTPQHLNCLRNPCTECVQRPAE